jgi:hypothetical protein
VFSTITGRTVQHGGKGVLTAMLSGALGLIRFGGQVNYLV